MLLKTQCFCGNDWNPDYTPTQVDMSECEGKRCDGNLTEWCGDDDRMLGTLFNQKPHSQPSSFHLLLQWNQNTCWPCLP